jgi:hypothetical protein
LNGAKRLVAPVAWGSLAVLVASVWAGTPKLEARRAAVESRRSQAPRTHSSSAPARGTPCLSRPSAGPPPPSGRWRPPPSPS